ncbi:MAG: type II toxin-antitoxin system VapC family toxin [Snowella sp.]|nr:type II toxin-antitoxin system VapC family toxin [Snowella sp.]
MTKYILNTDHVTALQRGNPIFLKRFRFVDDSQIFVTVITLEEQIRGRFSVISKFTNNPEKLPRAYADLHATFDFFTRMNLLDFDNFALSYYQKFRQQKIRIGTQDLKISAITLANQMTLLTRNHRDFSKVPNLIFEDWTIN